MSTRSGDFQCDSCGSPDSVQGSTLGGTSGCISCDARVKGGIRCSDPLCGKLKIHGQTGPYVCSCFSDYWTEVLRSLRGLQQRCCCACGDACVKSASGAPTAFCATHAKQKPQQHEITHCIICGSTDDTFVAGPWLCVCKGESCRKTLRELL